MADEKTKPGSNLALIIIIIVLVLIIIVGAGGVGVWYLYSKMKTTITASPSPVVTVTASPIISPTPTISPITKTTPTSGYVIADSDTRLIAEAELYSLTPWQLKVARNEIYARHGRPFVHQDMQCYFNLQSWYSINPNYSNDLLSSIETKNAETIKTYEQKINSPIFQVDTGC